MRFINTIKEIFIPFTIVPSTFIGFTTGLYVSLNENSSVDMFTNWIGYTSIGILTGISYPVSFPILAEYVIYKNH